MTFGVSAEVFLTIYSGRSSSDTAVVGRRRILPAGFERLLPPLNGLPWEVSRLSASPQTGLLSSLNGLKSEETSLPPHQIVVRRCAPSGRFNVVCVAETEDHESFRPNMPV